MLMPIDHVTGWLFQVARNRITDLFRKKQPERFSDVAIANDDEDLLLFEDLLPSPDAGPDAMYARQRPARRARRWRSTNCRRSSATCSSRTRSKARSFKEMSARTGVSVNTLLSRKRYAVMHLRRAAAG